MPASTETSGSGDGPSQNVAVEDPLVRLEVVAIGERELARQRRVPTHLVGAVRFGRSR